MELTLLLKAGNGISYCGENIKGKCCPNAEEDHDL
jgi:hypothetical protein